LLSARVLFCRRAPRAPRVRISALNWVSFLEDSSSEPFSLSSSSSLTNIAMFSIFFLGWVSTVAASSLFTRTVSPMNNAYLPASSLFAALLVRFEKPMLTWNTIPDLATELHLVDIRKLASRNSMPIRKPV